MDANGNFVCVWEDYRNSNYDIYCQRYNSSGDTLGVNFKVNDTTGTASQYSRPSIAIDGSGNFVIVWEDERNGYYYPDIYCQRYNSSGAAQGVNFKGNDDAGTADQLYPSIAMDGSGNFVVVWEDYRYGINNPDVIGQRYYANGSLQGTNYRIVADGPNYGEENPVVAANANTIVFAWMDNRRSKGWDIYGKVVGWDWDGVTSVLSEKNIPTEFALLQNYPNPFNPNTKIRYDIKQQAVNVKLIVYDIIGKEIITLVNQKENAGSYEADFDGTGYSSGVYFYQLSVEGNIIDTKKMILLK